MLCLPDDTGCMGISGMPLAGMHCDTNSRWQLRPALDCAFQGGTQAKGQDDEAGTATAGKAKKAKAGGVSKKAAKKSGAKPVRKKPGKATAGAKGRKKK